MCACTAPASRPARSPNGSRYAHSAPIAAICTKAISKGNRVVGDQRTWLAGAVALTADKVAGSNGANSAAHSVTAPSATKPPFQPVDGSTHHASRFANAICATAWVSMNTAVTRSGLAARTMVRVATHSSSPSARPAAARTSTNAVSPTAWVVARSSSAANSAASTAT